MAHAEIATRTGRDNTRGARQECRRTVAESNQGQGREGHVERALEGTIDRTWHFSDVLRQYSNSDDYATVLSVKVDRLC